MIRLESLFSPKNERVTLDTPLEHLMACHRRIEERLATLERAAAGLEEHRAEALAAFENAFRFMDSSGVLHTEDEEQSLFPRLLGHMQPDERAYLASLEEDHAEAERLYSALKATHAGAPADQVREITARLVALYRRHIASEDDALQAHARQLLNPSELAAIAAEMKRRRGV